MSVNVLKTVFDRIVTQLKDIDAGDNYNFRLRSQHVVGGFELWDNAVGYPSVYVPMIRETGSRFSDQVTSELPVEVEIFGYVKDEQEALSDAFKLASDIENAIRADEDLDDNVYGLSLLFEVSAFQDRGIVYCVLSATAQDVRT